MTPGELEGLIGRAAELPAFDAIPTDPLERRRWEERAAALVIDLRQAMESVLKAEGGSFAMRLREVFEERILAQVNGRVQLTDEVSEHTLGVHIVDECVIVDVRLRVGKARNDDASGSSSG